ncbi:MAG: TrkH family potassium uptake protein [Candidatus Thermoplasmatota archaeon]
MSNLKSVLRDIGAILIIIGFVVLLTLIVTFSTGEYLPSSGFNAVFPILITSAIFFGVGSPLFYFFRKAEEADFKSAMITAALGWFLISLICSIPFWLIPYDISSGAYFTMDPLSAFFESMSGWTGTGLTMVDNEQYLPYTLQFYRSLIQWVGGVGVIVLTLSILSRPGVGSFVLYQGEARERKTHPSIISTVRTIWWIFILYTVLGIVALTAIGLLYPSSGMSVWESINHAMTGIATGGFSVTDDSIAGFGIVSQIVVMILMVFGGVAFAAHFDLLKGKIKDFLADTQFKAMMFLIFLGVLAITFLNAESVYSYDWVTSLQVSSFQFISAISCTGFASVENLPLWSDSAKLILAFAMVIGGAAGSTAGGIKLFRAVLLYKGVGWRIKRAISTPRRVFVHKFGDKALSKDEAMDLINEAAIISFIWVIILSTGIIVVSTVVSRTLPNVTLSDVIFEVCSAQGNVGLSTGITRLEMNYIPKIMLIFNMWIGRLEIIPIIVLIRSIFGLRKNII